MPRIFVPSTHLDSPVDYVFGHHAQKQAAAGLMFSATVYKETLLPHRAIEAARYRTAQINGCITCQNWRAARDLSMVTGDSGDDSAKSFVERGDPAPDEAFYEAVEDWRNADADVFSPRERIAIEFAERMGAEPRSFEGDDDFWDRVHANFSESEIVDLTLAVASWIAMGRVMHVLEIDPKVCVIQPPQQAVA